MNIGDIKCPSCRRPMVPVKLHCGNCDLWIEGHFEMDALSRLSSEDLALAIAFIRSFGSIKKLQDAMGVSYPTARARLEKLVEKLNSGMTAKASPDRTLDQLKRGEISVKDALEVL